MTQSRIRSSAQLFVDVDLDVNSKKITNLATPTANTDAATKLYVDGIISANDAMQYKGVIDCTANPNYPAGNAGETWKVSVGGNIGGVSGIGVLVGDLIICTTDGTASGTQAVAGAAWDVVHVNGASGTMSSTAATPLDNQIVRLDSTTGTVVQNSLATIDDAGSVNVPAGQAYKVNGSALVSNATHTGDAIGGGALTVVALNGQNLAALESGLLKNVNGTGVPVIASPADITSQVLTGYTSGAGAVAATDTILQAINKLDGNNGTKQETSGKDASNGYAGLTLLKINFKNIANTITSFFTNSNTVARTYTFQDKDGTVALTSDIPTFVTREAAVGLKNGVNATFTLANTPTAGSEMIFLNGMLLNPGAGNDYTISGLTITMLIIPVSTDVLLATYRF
jgi:hypothetical protein